jgi:excisionase family DNA binding protein
MRPLTPTEIAERENVSVRFVIAEIHRGNLPARLVGKKGYRITAQAYQDWCCARNFVPRPDAVAKALLSVAGGDAA